MANPNGNPQNLIPLRLGQSGNPGGKPLYARNRLPSGFLNALAGEFENYGLAAIAEGRTSSRSRHQAASPWAQSNEARSAYGYQACLCGVAERAPPPTRPLNRQDHARLELP